jgi:hypothetical protein
MKQRFGFISNSSSSSFCIYGFHFTKDMVSEEEIKKWAGKDFSEDYKNNEFRFEFCEFVEEKLKGTKLSINSYEGEEGYYIGRDWSKIGDKETGKQFKDSVKKDVKTIFGKNIQNFETLGDGWAYSS